MFSTYSTADLIAKWGTINSPTTEQMIGHMLQNMLEIDARRKKNDESLIFQQTVIEEYEKRIKALEEENESLKTLEKENELLKDDVIDLKARVKLLEEHASLRRKENGQE